MSVISRADQTTLDSMEALLVGEKMSVRDALRAAYVLGELTGKIAMARKGENLYADAMIQRDKIERHTGRPEHDADTFGRPLKAGS